MREGRAGADGGIAGVRGPSALRAGQWPSALRACGGQRAAAGRAVARLQAVEDLCMVGAGRWQVGGGAAVRGYTIECSSSFSLLFIHSVDRLGRRRQVCSR